MKLIRRILTFLCVLPFFVPHFLQAVCDCPDNANKTVWFINNNNTSPMMPGGSGTYADPFVTFFDFKNGSGSSVTGAGGKNCDVIYVFPGDGTSNGYDTGLILLPGQRLLGTTDAAFPLCPAAGSCAVPRISNLLAGGSPAITIQGNNEVAGFIFTDATNSGCIRNTGDLSSPGLMVTNCQFFIGTTTFDLSPISIGPPGGIGVRQSSILGTVSISNCQFFGRAGTPPVNSFSLAMSFILNGTGAVNIFNTTITGSSDANTIPISLGILIGQMGGAYLTTSITNTTIALHNTAYSGIFIGNGPPEMSTSTVFPVIATLADNRVSLSTAPAITDDNYGAIVAGTGTRGTMCITLNDNSASVPGNHSAYILLNQNPGQHVFGLDNNNGNVGSVATSSNRTPPVPTSFPVELTTDCFAYPP